MNALLLVRAHTKVQFLDLIRWPGYVVPTVVFPAMFYSIFDLPVARANPRAADLWRLPSSLGRSSASRSTSSALASRKNAAAMKRYVRTLPASVFVRFGGRIATALLFGVITAAIVALVARVFTPIDLTLAQWLRVLLYAIAGGIPFVLIGITIGYWVSARASVPTATAVNLLLAYAGGLWMPPQYLPSFVATISPYLPTRQFGDLLWSVVGGGNATRAVVGLALYSAIFGLLAAIGYRRDERKRYA